MAKPSYKNIVDYQKYSQEHANKMADIWRNQTSYIMENVWKVILHLFEVGKTLGSAAHGFAEITISAVKGLHLGPSFMPLIAFLVFVSIIIAVIFSVVESKKKKNKKDTNISVQAPQPINFFNPLSMIGSLIPVPTYKMKLFSYNFAPYGKATIDNSVSDRPIMKSGRCDNLKNYEETSNGVCVNTSTPEPIVWTLDIETMPELNELSVATKAKVADATKFIVTIPWAIYEDGGLHYYPDCKKATFHNGESAAYLFTDNGTRSCERKSIKRTINGIKTRPNYMSDKYQGIEVYSS